MELRAGHEVEVGRGVLANHDVARLLGKAKGAHAARAARDTSLPRTLKRAHGGRAYGDHAMTGCLRGVDRVDHLLRDVVTLGVHNMLGRVVLGHEPEGVDAHLELDACPFDALRLDALDKLGREVQAGGGRRSGVLLAHGVDGLVLLGVALVLGDIGRKRHVPRGVNGLVEREGGACGGIEALRVEADKTAALRALDEVDDRAREDNGGGIRRVKAACAILDHDPGLLKALSGVNEALPHVAERVHVLTAPKKQRLADAAGPALLADEASGKDARFVRDDQIPRLEIVDDVGKHLMLDVAVLAVENKQATGVARLYRSLGDELVWKGVIEIVGAHSF